jgi:hypothetical protein
MPLSDEFPVMERGWENPMWPAKAREQTSAIVVKSEIARSFRGAQARNARILYSQIDSIFSNQQAKSHSRDKKESHKPARHFPEPIRGAPMSTKNCCSSAKPGLGDLSLTKTG